LLHPPIPCSPAWVPSTGCSSMAGE
jgi:hypothetical protein